MVEAVIGEGGFKPVPRRCWSHRTLGGQRVGQGVHVSGGGGAHGVTQGEATPDWRGWVARRWRRDVQAEGLRNHPVSCRAREGRRRLLMQPLPMVALMAPAPLLPQSLPAAASPLLLVFVGEREGRRSPVGSWVSSCPSQRQWLPQPQRPVPTAAIGHTLAGLWPPSPPSQQGRRQALPRPIP